MNIGMILDNEFTGDMRVENEVMSLQNAGFKVYILCINHGNKPELEVFHGASIIRMKLSKWKNNKMRGSCNTLIDLYTPYWKRKIIQFVHTYKIDLLHVHDLYLVGAALEARKRLGFKIQIVADLHENYPQALSHYKFMQNFPAKWIISVSKWIETEKVWLDQVDHIITVIEEARSRYCAIGLPQEKITVVPNYINIIQFMSYNGIIEHIQKLENKFMALYIGGFDKHRGLETVIDAIPKILEMVPDFHLSLVGSGSNENDLKIKAKELNVSDVISFKGWQNPKYLPSYINMADICLVPHIKTAHTDNTIPHKLFHYMYMAKPVLVSNCDPLKRIVEDTKCGKVFTSQDSDDFAIKICDFAKLNNLSHFGKNGHESVNEKYNWFTAEKELLKLYERISG